jgi:uncharacterized membrane protein YkoI
LLVCCCRFSGLALEGVFLGSLTFPQEIRPPDSASLPLWRHLMRAMPRRAQAAVPAAVLMFALVACGGGADSGDSASGASDRQAAQDAGAEGGAANEEAEGADAVETPLTGEAKKKAEAAALAEFPGTVVKSEEDAENPGTYAVEIKKEDGSEVEVYLDPKTYKVLKTKNEEGDEDGS